eukprot:evm.model.scf_370.3 EVM.evm.TU.scf_370.3   scf_370:61367-62034(-)
MGRPWGPSWLSVCLLMCVHFARCDDYAQYERWFSCRWDRFPRLVRVLGGGRACAGVLYGDQHVITSATCSEQSKTNPVVVIGKDDGHSSWAGRSELVRPKTV